MANRPVTITKTELAGYAQVMREASVESWTVEAIKPDGTRLIITAGVTASRGNDIDGLLGLNR